MNEFNWLLSLKERNQFLLSKISVGIIFYTAFIVTGVGFNFLPLPNIL